MAIDTSEILARSFAAALRLQGDFRRSDYAGYDPYDGLNTFRFPGTLFKHQRFSRLVLIHANKRSIYNLRPFFGVRKSVNAKLLGLVLAGQRRLQPDAPIPQRAVELLEQTASTQSSHKAWGYYFDWQSRVFFLPADTPSIVATSFVAQGLMDWAPQDKDHPLLQQVASSIEFITGELNRYEDENGLCFSYSPADNSIIYNASLLGLEVVARYGTMCGQQSQWQAELQAGLNFIRAEQNEDGSWYYGKQLVQRFIDHYHTAYILDALENIRLYRNDDQLLPVIQKGLRFYLENLFTDQQAPKYFKNAVFPLESHCCGAAIKALCVLSEHHGEHLYQKALQVAAWALEHLYDVQKGYFYYQKRKYWTNRINYLRWSQGWMYAGLSWLVAYGRRYGYTFDEDSRRQG